MFSQINSCPRRFAMESQYFSQPGEPINSYQPWIYQNRYQNYNQFYDYFESEQQYPGLNIQGSNGFNPGSKYGKIKFQETGDEKESEAVDELLQILTECLKKADMKKREILLRKFFFEIEKEESLERFLVERIKHSRIHDLLPESSENIPGCSDGINNSLLATREINVFSGEESSEKLERFKIKTVHVAEIVKEEAE